MNSARPSELHSTPSPNRLRPHAPPRRHSPDLSAFVGAIALLCFSASSSRATEPDEGPAELARAARAALSHRDWAQAQEKLTACLEIDSKDKTCLSLQKKLHAGRITELLALSKEQVRLKRFDEARDTVATCLSIDIDHPRCNAMYSTISVAEERHEEEIRAQTRRLYPRLWLARIHDAGLVLVYATSAGPKHTTFQLYWPNISPETLDLLDQKRIVDLSDLKSAGYTKLVIFPRSRYDELPKHYWNIDLTTLD